MLTLVPVVRRGTYLNHNETLVPVVRHGIKLPNHNETLMPVVRHSLPMNHTAVRISVPTAILTLAVVLAAWAAALAAEARTLGTGNAGADVAALTTRLAKLGYLPDGARGSTFTDATRHAVVAFQKWEGLARDGLVGPQTSAALGTASRPKPVKYGDVTP